MFQPDSRLIRFLTRICDLMILNILFLLSCMTVVFSGAGAVSLYTVTLRMFRGTEDSPGKSFLRSVRQNFALSFQAALLLLGDAALLAVLRGVLHAAPLPGGVCVSRYRCRLSDGPVVLSGSAVGPL